MTYNIWASSRWPDRKAPLKCFLEYHQPDILCLQELRLETRNLIDEVLTGHQRIDDSFEGWTREGNIYFNQELFEFVEYGAEDIEMYEEARRLFWTRLRSRFTPGRTLFVSTAHYTWAGNPQEKGGGINPRYAQAQKTVDVLQQLAPETEPLLFMGDLNDFVHPIRILQAGGLCDSFSGLGRHTDYTHPANPTAKGTPQSIDWIFHRGPIKPMTSEVVDFYLNDLAPSDHKPVLATYCLA
jgi:exonuclease III